jgi:phosphoribosylanthranilate isomerase
MWIKICGNTNLEDCELAAALGADAVGFVFAAGKRTVTAAQVGAITVCLSPELEKIGVFTTASFSQILETAREAGLTGVQLHGAFAPNLLQALREALPRPQKVIQVLHWYTDAPAEEQADGFAGQAADVERNGTADAVLVDSRTRAASGGTGVVFDWGAARPALRGVSLPLIVAGGLNPGNVAAAITTLDAWGVDVASGVEQSPGRKDAERLRIFIENARAASRR